MYISQQQPPHAHLLMHINTYMYNTGSHAFHAVTVLPLVAVRSEGSHCEFNGLDVSFLCILSG